MNVINLDGTTQNWVVKGEIVTAADTKGRSKLHLCARRILYALFPTMPILEEVPVKIGPNPQFFDFFINKLKLVVEVHGQQHYKFNSLFHSCANDFLNQKKRDRNKQEWCKINNITYVELPYNEDEEQWKKRVINR